MKGEEVKQLKAAQPGSSRALQTTSAAAAVAGPTPASIQAPTVPARGLPRTGSGLGAQAFRDSFQSGDAPPSLPSKPKPVPKPTSKPAQMLGGGLLKERLAAFGGVGGGGVGGGSRPPAPPNKPVKAAGKPARPSRLGGGGGGGGTYSLAVLQGVKLPDDVDPMNKELSLHADEFMATFGMPKEVFSSLADFMKARLLGDAGLEPDPQYAARREAEQLAVEEAERTLAGEARRREAAAKAKAETEERARKVEAARANAEAEARAKAERERGAAEDRARQAEIARAKAEGEVEAKAEAQRRAEAAAKENAPLLPGWEAVDSGEGDCYYWSRRTDETRWDRPTAPVISRPPPPPKAVKPARPQAKLARPQAKPARPPKSTASGAVGTGGVRAMAAAFSSGGGSLHRPPSLRSNITSNGKPVYSLEVLGRTLSAGLPADVDPTCKEEHLNDDEFTRLFGMDKASFR